jgi:hypothetical protein
VNDRVQQETEGTRGFLRRNLGDRFALAFYGSRERTRTDSEDYLGTDLGETLTEDRYEAGGELRIALSVKSQMVSGGEENWYRFPRLPERDGRSTLAYGGFRTEATALVAGEALAGYRWFRLDTGEGGRPLRERGRHLEPVAKDEVGGRSPAISSISAFQTGSAATNQTGGPRSSSTSAGRQPTSDLRTAEPARLGRHRDHRAARGEPESAVRDDRAREVGAELGYQFRTRLRVGVTATYTKRESSIETFGIEGLLAGLTVRYNPPQPAFR